MIAEFRADGSRELLVITVPGREEITLPVRDATLGHWGMGIIDLPMPPGAVISVTPDTGRLYVSGPGAGGSIQYQPWGRWYADAPGIDGEGADTLAEAVALVLGAGTEG